MHNTTSKGFSKVFIILGAIFAFLTLSPVYVEAGSSCFLQGTLITMSDGSQVPIEHIDPGFKVFSFDNNMNGIISEVLEVESPIRDDYYVIAFEDGKELKLTNEHPMYIKKSSYIGWGSIMPQKTMMDSGMKTEKIEKGDYILSLSKEWVKIVDISHINKKVQTYNLKKVDKTNTFFAEGFLAHNKGTPPPPPPPPPPCGYQTPGCYKEGGIKADSGSLTAETFSYYLSQNACIGGGCTCSQEGFVDKLKQTDPDKASGACACISGTSWSDNIGCCGDDRSDCGLIFEEKRFGETIERHLCSMDSNFIGSWIPAEPNVGLISYIGCANKEMLSDGNIWLECNSSGAKRIDDREYLCAGSLADQKWIECCGSGSCKSDSSRAGDTLSTGKSIKLGEITYYCASDKTFASDLDIKDQSTCQGAGLTWTGTLCCSESDDTEEYYNDPAGGRGGCWDKKAVLNGEQAPQIKNVANIGGQFYGCNVNNNSILNIKDYHTLQPVVQNKQYCFQDPNKFYFCSFNNEWELSSGQDRSHLSTIPESFQNAQQPSECCSATSCWDGAQCILNQRDKPNAAPISGFRCVDGDWVNASLKFNPQEDTAGFCPEQGQCFVNPSGNPNENNQPDKNPVCIANKQFIKDSYCENGEWTSRTKFVALQLIDIAKTSDFVVFCDAPENTLNNLNYLVQGQLVGSFVTGENNNNVCALTFSNKVLIGVSLNKPVTELNSFLKVLGVDNCNAAFINDSQYHTCASSNKVWYNQKLNSIIYSNSAFTLGPTNFFDTFITFIKNPFDAMKIRIMATIREPFDTSYLDSLKSFNKLYISKAGDKEIRGSIEGKGFKNLIVEYKNFNTDICSFVNEFNRKNMDAGSGIECSMDGNAYYVLSQGTEFTKTNPDKIWNDLTSKLRLA